MSHPSSTLRQQRGAALLAAMLTVTLVATIAASAVWQQWRNLEVEGAERTRVQAAWLLLGGLDFSRHVLRQDARTAGTVDSLSEPWSVPLAEARLTTFLQASNNQSNVDDDAAIDAAQAFLSGAIVDAQARLNIRNLVNGSSLSPSHLHQFERLFERLGLPQAELTVLSQQALAAWRSDAQTSNAPLVPGTFKELTWWGLSPATLAALEPYAAILPDKTRLNVNTASALALWAAVDGLDFATAQQIVQQRQARAFSNTGELAERFPNQLALAQAVSDNLLAVNTAYFEVWARLRFDDLAVQEKSLVYRQGLKVTTVVRERGAALSSALLGDSPDAGMPAP